MGTFADLLSNSFAPDTPSNADITYDPKKTLGFGSQARASFASDDDEYIRAIAQSLYPKEPLEQSVKRFGKTQEGKIFHKADDGKMYDITPQEGMARASNIGQAAGSMFPIVGSLMGAIPTAPAAVTGIGTAGTIAASSAGAAAGEVARQKFGDWLLGEASTSKGPTDIEPTSVAQEAALGAVGEGIGIGAGKLYQRYLAPDITRYSSEAANKLYDLAEKFKIRLTPAEATGLDSEIAAQKILKGYPQSANTMKDFYKERSNEVVDSFDRFLDNVGRPQDPAYLGETVKNMSDAIIKGKEKLRSTNTSPYYKDVEKNIGTIDVQPIINSLEQAKKTAKGPVLNALETAQKLLTKNGTGTKKIPAVAENEYAPLQQAKQVIDYLIDDPDFASRSGIYKYAGSELSDIRSKLTEAISKAPNNNGRYELANKAFADETKTLVEPAIQALSPFTRINPQRGTLLTQAATSMLGPNRSPKLIKDARDLFLNGPEPQKEAWDSVVRQFIENEATRALKEAAKDNVINPAGKLFNSFADRRTRDNLKAALGTAQYREFEDLMEVYSAAARAVDQNSDTQFKKMAQDTFENVNQGNMSKAIGFARPVQWMKQAQDFFKRNSIEKQASKLAEILRKGDRSTLQELRSLRNKTPQEWKTNAALGNAFVRALQLGTNEVTEEN